MHPTSTTPYPSTHPTRDRKVAVFPPSSPPENGQTHPFLHLIDRVDRSVRDLPEPLGQLLGLSDDLPQPLVHGLEADIPLPHLLHHVRIERDGFVMARVDEGTRLHHHEHPLPVRGILEELGSWHPHRRVDGKHLMQVSRGLAVGEDDPTALSKVTPRVGLLHVIPPEPSE